MSYLVSNGRRSKVIEKFLKVKRVTCLFDSLFFIDGDDLV